VDDIRRLRRFADYETGTLWQFASDSEAIDADRQAEKTVALFDAIDSDVPRRTTILTEIPAVHP